MINYFFTFGYNKRALLACVARLADTLCPPEEPGVTLINYNGNNIPKYVGTTVTV